MAARAGKRTTIDGRWVGVGVAVLWVVLLVAIYWVIVELKMGGEEGIRTDGGQESGSVESGPGAGG